MCFVLVFQYYYALTVFVKLNCFYQLLDFRFALASPSLFINTPLHSYCFDVVTCAHLSDRASFSCQKKIISKPLVCSWETKCGYFGNSPHVHSSKTVCQGRRKNCFEVSGRCTWGWVTNTSQHIKAGARTRQDRQQLQPSWAGTRRNSEDGTF